jgi:hypothetical protein
MKGKHEKSLLSYWPSMLLVDFVSDQARSQNFWRKVPNWIHQTRIPVSADVWYFLHLLLVSICKTPPMYLLSKVQ